MQRCKTKDIEARMSQICAIFKSLAHMTNMRYYQFVQMSVLSKVEKLNYVGASQAPTWLE